MRRRLTWAIVGTVVVTLVVVGVGTLVLARIDARSRTIEDLEQRAVDVADAVAELPEGREVDVLRRLRGSLDLDGVTLVRLGVRNPVGPRQPLLPAGVELEALDAAALRAGAVVSGVRGSTAYAAAAVPDRVGSVALPVVVVTNGIASDIGPAGRWFVLAGVVTVAVAAVVARRLGRALAGPVAEAEATTRRIAAGDLAARVPAPPEHADDELARLARSINTMAEELERSRGLERQFLLSVSHDLRTPADVDPGLGRGHRRRRRRGARRRRRGRRGRVPPARAAGARPARPRPPRRPALLARRRRRRPRRCRRRDRRRHAARTSRTPASRSGSRATAGCPSPATPTVSRRWRPTSSRTPGSSPGRTITVRAVARRRRRASCRSTTTAPASTPRTSPTSSNGSTWPAAGPCGPSRAPAWGSPSCASSRRPWAVVSRPVLHRAAAPAWRSACRPCVAAPPTSVHRAPASDGRCTIVPSPDDECASSTGFRRSLHDRLRPPARRPSFTSRRCRRPRRQRPRRRARPCDRPVPSPTRRPRW